MRKLFFLLCAMMSLSVASAQTDKPTVSSEKEVKNEATITKSDGKVITTTKKKMVNARAKSGVANDSTALVDPTDTPLEGSNSRNPSRNNTYNAKK